MAKSAILRPCRAGKVITRSALVMLVTFSASVKLDTPWLGSWSNLMLLFSPLLTNKLICKSSVAATGISLQSAEAPKLVHERSSG